MKNDQKQNKFLEPYLKPGQRAPTKLLKQLAVINENYTKSNNFTLYSEQLRKLFQLDSAPNHYDEPLKFYLGGFFEGEGSLNVGAKKNKASTFKVYFDPEFNLTQSINGIWNLYIALFFKKGRIRFKSGSLATFVYTIDDRKTLKTQVCSFYKMYVHKYGCQTKKQRTYLFESLLDLFNQKVHLTLDGMKEEIIPRWDALRMQKGQKNQTFKDRHDAITYVENASKISLEKSKVP